MNYFTGIRYKIWPKKIRSQLILGIVIIHLLLMGIFVYDMTTRQKVFLKEQHLEQTRSMVSEFALNSKNYIIIRDLDGLERLTLAQKSFPNLKYAMILTPDKDVIMHTNKNYIGAKPNDKTSLGLKDIEQTQILLDDNSIIDIASPVMQDDKIIAWARVGIGQEYIQENLAGIIKKGILYMAIALIIGFVVAITVGNRLNKGLYSLIDTTDKIKEGNRKLRVSPFQTVEISKLGTTFNQMLDEISANEKLQEMVLENLSVGVFVLDERGKIKSANTASKELWKNILYVGPEKFGEYKAWFTDTRQQVQANEWGAAVVLATGKPVLNQEMEIACFDGSRKTILNSAIPLKDDNGKIINVIVINVDITDRKKAEAVILKTNHEIGERVKELTCLYFLTKFVNDPEKSMVDILQECVNIIPPSYQYPEVTTVSIMFGDQKFESPNFSGSLWKQEAHIISNDSKIGLIEVFYTHKMPDEQEGPFLKEERLLINSIADIIGSAAERRKAEAVIKEQAETFGAIIENTKESIYLISPDFKILQFNKTALERLRRSRGMELYNGLDFREFLFPDTIDVFHSMFEDALKGASRTEEIKAQGINGDFFWFQTKMSPVYDPSGKLIGVTMLTEGIDDRKKAEAELRESEEKFRSLVEQSLVGVYIIRNNKLAYVNPGFKKIFGYSDDQSLDRMTFEEFVHRDDLEMIRNNYSLRIDGKIPHDQYIFRGIKNDGSVLHLEVIVSMIVYEGTPAIIGTLIDITSRLEEEKRITKAVTKAQEEERYEIGGELHDNVCQILATSLIFLGLMKKSITPELNKYFSQTQEYITLASNEIRNLSHQLAPAFFDNSTLEDAFKHLLKNFNAEKKYKVILYFDKDAKTMKISRDLQLNLYRILQEQLRNISKHAHASNIEVEVSINNDIIEMKIVDDGVGFDTKAGKGGIGLANMKRRVQLFSGTFIIHSEKDKGCEVIVEIPLMENAV